MHLQFKRLAILCVAPVALLALLAVGPAQLRAQNAAKPQRQSAGQPETRWGKVSVRMPASAAVFPDGEGAVIANSQCLICHSEGMVSHQPALTQGQWKDIINKMRNAYGAPLAAGQVDALAAYLSRLAPGGEGTDIERPKTAGGAGTPAGDGAQIFAARCAACHQAGGTGIPGVFPPLAGSNWVTGSDIAAVRILLHGVQGTLTVNGAAYNGAMPGFASQLSDAEIAAVLSYVRSQWGNEAEPVGTSLVTAERATTAARSEPWNGDADLVFK